MSVSAAVLFVAGGLLQIAGVLLVASPDIFPFLRRFARWLYPRNVRLANRLRRLVRRPPRRHVVEGAGGITARGHVSGSGYVSPSEALSLGETVAWLVRRAENAQQEHAALAARVDEAKRRPSPAQRSCNASSRLMSPRRSSRRTASTCRSG